MGAMRFVDEDNRYGKGFGKRPARVSLVLDVLGST